MLTIGTRRPTNSKGATVQDRRITPKTEDDRDSRLKHIAGLIQKLTYSEMNQLAVLIAQDVNVDSFQNVPAGLLKVSDRILNDKSGDVL